MSGFYNSRLAPRKIRILKVVIPPRISGFYNLTIVIIVLLAVVIPPRMSGFYNQNVVKGEFYAIQLSYRPE